MADIVNLRNARKSKLQADKATQAAENRARHGRTRAERERDERTADTLRRALDGAKQDEP